MSNGVDINLKISSSAIRKKQIRGYSFMYLMLVRKDSTKVSIITVDTDCAVIALYHYLDLQIDELWVEFGVREHKRWLPIHDTLRS